MKDLNIHFIKKSLSLGNGSGMTREWFGNDSIVSRFSLASLICVLMLTLGVGNAWGVAKTITYAPASTSSVSVTSGTPPSGASASFSSTYTDKNQLTGGKKQTLTLSGYDGCTITGVKLNMKRTSSGPAATVNITVNGSTKLATNASITLTTTAGDKTVTLANTTTVVGESKTLVIEVSASKNSIYVYNYQISYDEPVEPHEVSFVTGAGNPSVASRTEAEAEAGITLPSTSDLTPACSDDGWTLYGWATAAYGSSSTTTAPTSTLVGYAGDTYYPNADITLYAVYAKVATDVAASAQTLSFDYSTTTWKKNHYTDKGTYWLIHGTDGYIESPVMLDLSKITSIVVQAGYYGGSGYGKFQMSGAGTNYGTQQSCSNNNQTTSYTVNPSPNPLSGRGKVKLQCTGTASNDNGVRVLSITINYTAPPTYYWSAPTCSPACDKPTALTKGSINSSSQTVSWTAPGGVRPTNGYLVAYSTSTSTDPTVHASDATYTIAAVTDAETYNIPCNTAGTYNWWVCSKCGESDYSTWEKGTAFTMKTIYLKTNANWRTSSPKFAVYFWDATNNGWTPFMDNQTDCEEGVKKVVFPTDYTNMKFVRCNPADGTPQFGEGHAWNETGNLTLPANKDCFTLPADAWSGTTNGTSDANWSVYAQKYQISFNLNKGGASFSTYPASAPDSRCVETGSTTSAPTDPVALGKVINGWYKESGCSNQWVFASQTVSANQELFANWEDVATKTIYLDASASLSGGNRWDQDGATDLVMFAHAYIDNTGDPGLYYNVKMTAVSTCQPHVYSCAIPGNATHVSFARCANGTTELPVSWTNPPVYNQIAGKTVESGKNLYTITDWGAATLESSPFSPTSYTMSYAAGTTPNKGGAAIGGGKSDESKACDVAYTLPSSAVFSVTGYRQTAWTTSDGGTQTHAFSGSYTTNAAQAFYPVWTANTYQVAFNANGGGGSAMSNQSFTYDEAAKPLTSNTYTAPSEHKYFAGWATSSSRASAGTVDYTDGQSVNNLSSTHNATVTLYAVWKDHTFTNYRTLCSALFDIVLDDGLVATTNNGSAKVANNGTTLTNIVAPTKSGYDVEGYYTTNGGSTKIATAAGALSANVTVSGDDWTNESSQWVLGSGATFYAKWNAHTYNLTYEGLEGATHTNPATYTIETSTITLTDPSARTGYTFTGWTCGGDAITTIALGSTGDKTITANWTINKHTVAVSAADHVVITATPAGGSAIAEGSSTANINYGTTVTLNCTPDDHWNLVWDVYKTGESSTKLAVTGSGDGATFTLPDYNVTVTAVMTEDTYHTATFKNNGAVIAGYDAVKTYDGERPSAPTLTDITDACDKTDCNKFYGWIAEDAIWSKTINSVAGKTIYRHASDIPVVDGADVVYHAVWAKGEAAPALIAPTPIIYWARQSIAASTNISATSGTGTLNSNVAFTDDTYEKVYNSGSLSSYPTITLSSLNMSSATGSTVNISFFTRGTNASAGTLTVKYTDSGNEYTAGTVTVVSKQVCYHEVSGIPKTATQIKLEHGANGGNLAIGTIKIFEPNTTSYTFTELTSENTSGWANGDWDGNYLITNGSTTALDGNGIGEKNFATVSASDGTITTTNSGAAFVVTWVSGSGFKVQGVGCGDYLNTASNSVAPSGSIVYLSGMAYNGITDGSSNTLRYNSTKFGFYASAGTDIKLYKILASYTAFRITCCDKTVTIGTPAKTGSGTVTFASGGDAYAAGDEVETCAGETTITATVSPTNGYQCTALEFTRSDSEDLDPDPAISVPFTSAQSYDLTFEQNADGVTLNTTVTFVALIDHYIDNMHYNTTQNKSGNYGTAPTLSDESKGEQCTGLHYKFVGWIPETDMDMTTGVPTTTANMVAGGATGKYATGTNYYAIWAEEE